MNDFVFNRSPSRLKVGTRTTLGEGFTITRGQKQTWRVGHDEYTTGIHIWLRSRGLVHGQWQFIRGRRRHTEQWFLIYDGEGSAAEFRRFREAVEYAKTQIRAVLAAKRLGYEGGKLSP